MNRFQSKSVNSITHFFIYALTFLLIWEWLRPIPVITSTGQIEIFVWFTFFSAALIYLRIPAYITGPAIFIGSIFCLHIIFFEGSFLSWEGGIATFQTFLTELAVNTALIFSGNFAGLTDLFRTFLLFMLLAIICYLLYFWVLYTRKVFFFLLCTIVYITVLDTFTLVDASQAIVRIVVIGFFMLTLLHMLKVQDEERAIGRRKGAFISPAWMYTLITVVSIAVLAGFIAPKPEPQWSDPVPAMMTMVGGESFGSNSSGTIRRIGYGENDERLGGGFIQDDGVVFQAEIDRETYWRGESKDQYTGQGWVSEGDFTSFDSAAGELENYRMFEEEAGLEEGQVSIEMAEDANFELLFYPGQLQGIEAAEGTAGGEAAAQEEMQFYADEAAGRFRAEAQEEDVFFESYELTFEDTAFPIESLRNTEAADPERITEQYLQLPEELPERVVELAEEITKEHDNRYDKVVAVERYFSQNDFEYSTTDVPIPEEGEDYVDQFLFETQTGYCDNFSTSMAVMLRAVDIPVRWVKGFTSGEEVEELDNGNSIYEVANSNAHSWVEVYFPEVGWIPFEPTQGFTNYAEFEMASPELDMDDIESADTPDPEFPDHENSEVDDLLDEGAEDSGPVAGANDNNSGGFFTLKNVLISIPLTIFVMILHHYQNIIQNKFFLYRYRWFGRDDTFHRAYSRLLWILQNEGLPRAEGETLREYARRVDLAVGSQAMMKLTMTYERICYGGRSAEGTWKEGKKEWEEIVKTLNA
ncbi:transglutaminaseTgpA domain-containing protein [Alkalicoccus daliensis]|uniref:Transglutaminase-like domain-containing protein n=1 Tax=Alkalicoccus daliensis TaxID=745820 RepID=A0A1H0KJ49_9BACI|nr:transglutaminaseTgpA domain-containing protein [Alkalicoccus daliensis]SDO55761.1 protein of unknown function [Alkalicoccus daliensis]